MSNNVDLQLYQKFVQGVTSRESMNFDDFPAVFSRCSHTTVSFANPCLLEFVPVLAISPAIFASTLSTASSPQPNPELVQLDA